MKGQNEQVTRAFIKKYNDEVVWFEDLQIIVDEEIIAEVIGLPFEGEKWFKQQSFEVDYSKFLFPGFEKLDRKNGKHVTKLNPIWKTPLEMIQNYVTCEGRYDSVLRCHLRFSMHISRDKKLNLPHYLLKSIQKMISRVHSHQEHTVCSLFHQGLIKLLIVFHLNKRGKTWEEFLFEYGFDIEKQKGEIKGTKDSATDNQIEQEPKTLDAEDKGLAEKWSQVNDELSEACTIKNDDKGVE